MYALNLSKDNRILCVLDVLDGQPYDGMPMVEKRPEDIVGENATDKEKDAYNYLYVDGEYVYEPLPEIIDNTERVIELKQMLADTDYIVIKIAEGVSTWEEYPEIKAQRQAWRDEINELETTE